MIDGEWRMIDGEWKMIDGEWRMIDGGGEKMGKKSRISIDASLTLDFRDKEESNNILL